MKYLRLSLLFVALWAAGLLWMIKTHHLLPTSSPLDRTQDHSLSLAKERAALRAERLSLKREFDRLLEEKDQLRNERARDHEKCKRQRSATELDFERTNIFGNAGEERYKFNKEVLTFMKEQTKLISQRADDLPRSEREWKPESLIIRENEPYKCHTDPHETCTWHASEAFFQAESSAPQISDSNLKRLKFLLIDQHGGPLLDTLGYLLNLGVPRHNIKTFCGNGPHCSERDTDKELLGLHAYFTGPGLGTWEHGHDYLAEVQNNITALKMGRFDIMICLYPGFQCAMARPLATHLIVRPTNRWQEGLQDIPPRQQPTPPRLLHWADIVRKMGTCPNMALSASNAYDWILFKHDLGIPALPWPSLALNQKPQIDEIDEFVPPDAVRSQLLYTHLQPYFNDAYCGLMLYWLLDASEGSRLFEIHHAHYHGKNFREYAAVLIFPYNVQVTKFVEYYMAGVPLLCPSLKLYTEWHYQHNVCFHRTTGYLPNNDYLPWNYSNYPESDGSPCCGIHSLRKEHAYWWLPMADYYHWPNVTYFDSWKELREAFLKIRDDKQHRRDLIKGMMAYKKLLFQRSSTVIRAQLQAMILAEERNETCSEFGVLGV